MPDWKLNSSLSELIGDEVGVSPVVVSRVVELFQKGDEVAYVARYKGHVHGDLDCGKIRKIAEINKKYSDLNNTVVKAMASIASKDTVSASEKQAIMGQLAEVREAEDVKAITSAFSQGSRTKADKARQLGMADVAERIMQGETVDLRRLVDPKTKELKTFDAVQEQVTFSLADLMNHLPDVAALVKEIAHLRTRHRPFVSCVMNNKAKKLTKQDRNFHLIQHYANYMNFSRPANVVENYQVLAMSKGNSEDILTWKVEVKPNLAADHPAKSLINRIAKPHQELYQKAVKDSIDRLFIPRIERAVKRFLMERAEQAAIECFARNLAQLFSQESLVCNYVVALDPGFRGCKGALLSADGSVIDAVEFMMTNKTFDVKGNDILCRWAKLAGESLIVAVGNGTACNETQTAVSSMIRQKKFGDCNVRFCVVSECGASKYSITEASQTELPNLNPRLRSAVSIGRRLIDPMAEYVKIEPQHLGVGMYQHSVNQKKLLTTLNSVVVDEVSLRGVDVNTASAQLLRQVCGLNVTTAKGIVDLREKNGGRISSRAELQKVKGLGKAAFSNAAGFLLISPPSDGQSNEGEPSKKRKKSDYDPLDTTIIHPDQYATATKLLQRLKIAKEDLTGETARKKLSGVNLNDLTDDERSVVQLLLTPPKRVPPPPLLTEVRKLASLRVDERMIGRVSNVTDFGIFIDIGADRDGMVYKRNLPQPHPEVGTQLMVRITAVDTNTNRISLEFVE